MSDNLCWERTMAVTKLYIKRYKLAPIVTVLCNRKFACMNVRAEPFYMHENQSTQILNLSSPGRKDIYFQS